MFTGKMAEQAIDLALPTVEALAAQDVTNGRDLHIVVAVREPGYTDALVLAERSLGNTDLWRYRYDTIARNKADISARTGLSSREVQLLRPELLVEGDTKYWGSVVDGNLVAACSGVQSHFDEAISRVILAIARGLMDEDVAERRKDMSSSTF